MWGRPVGVPCWCGHQTGPEGWLQAVGTHPCSSYFAGESGLVQMARSLSSSSVCVCVHSPCSRFNKDMTVLAGKCGCGLVGRAILATGVELLWLPGSFLQRCTLPVNYLGLYIAPLLCVFGNPMC